MRNIATVQEIKHPKYTHRVRFPKAGGKWGTKHFESAEDAEAHADEFNKDLIKHGAEEASISKADRVAVSTFYREVAELQGGSVKVKVATALNHYLETLRARYKSVPCSEVANQFVDAHDRKWSHEQRRSVRPRIKRFLDEYGDWFACDVSPEIVSEFLDDLTARSGKNQGQPISDQTKLHYWQVVHQMFKTAIKTGAAQINPANEDNKPGVMSKKPGTLRPREVAALLHAADSDVVAAIAISFFAGVRRSELVQLDWKNVDLEYQFIEIPREITKTAEGERNIHIEPNLIEWLKPHAQIGGKVVSSPGRYRIGLADAIAKAGIEEWPHNAGRHSFATYHRAHFKTDAKTATQLGHSDSKLLKTRYSKTVHPKIAAEYWEIRPTAKITHLRKGKQA
ncbi:tyrosine-type recombinase/integrase [Sulfuriroseicoccus oceanibius]|uniref:Tyrosine-type recombinase/integrase n=1 Tax=Sulfuriroseicoccus oceanibius TaxID=2707525 RepID=A0A6B3L7R1_9BACT|nr:tyrosine-type recombinase/integrase [Sulfuriroseicoccus oceanibius]QQL44227.1 tyrosine-type recombinase/integrase [Sulfuriroseicoccus oceanibius]